MTTCSTPLRCGPPVKSGSPVECGAPGRGMKPAKRGTLAQVIGESFDPLPTVIEKPGPTVLTKLNTQC
jgi:hypothetical protein